ncbi:MAG: tetratricopeptide repeat protein [Myxococcales bacterium]|nr:tetratricopeptide repeat protein [Myxococcales bacterium]
MGAPPASTRSTRSRPSRLARALGLGACLIGAPLAHAQPNPGGPGAAPAAPPPTAAAAPAAAAPDPARADRARAYKTALGARRLGEVDELADRDLAARVTAAEALARAGRTDEAIAKLTDLVEDPRFDRSLGTEPARAALFILGEAYGTAGIHEPARAYLRRAVTDKGAWDEKSPYAKRAVRRLVEIALESRAFAAGLEDLKGVPPSAPDEVRAEVSYLTGRSREAAKDWDGALAAYAQVPTSSRFWSQATYLSGLIQVERGRAREGEALFCKVADPKRQDKTTPVLADEKFFAVRDLARLALGRVAHEGSRFDDARYYYYLVPRDSDRLAEALYESATSRYEKKDYDGAKDLLDELRTLGAHHRYEDEAEILGAYVDLALCHFPEADKKLNAFIAKYEPIRDAARRLGDSERSTQALIGAARSGADAGGIDLAGVSATPEALRSVASLLRIDPLYVQIARKRTVLDHEADGLRATMGTLSGLSRAVATPGATQPSVPEGNPAERAAEVRAAIDGTRKAIDDLEAHKAPNDKIAPLRQELAQLEARAQSSGALSATGAADAQLPADLPGLLRADAALGARMQAEVEVARRELGAAEAALARDALKRLDLRLSRLLRRARLGRIESVLGKKRALEVEIEALADGYLPRDAVDSLDAARYLKDNEEYWPFEGDDWPDEFVGAEGIK